MKTKTNILKGILLGVLLIFSEEYTFGSVIVASGTISTNTTWSDTVQVTGDVTISSGVTLTIKSFSRILFQGYYGITCYGKITAVGSRIKFGNILFARQDTSGFYRAQESGHYEGVWKGIKLLGSDTSIFSICTFFYGKADTYNSGIIYIGSGFASIANTTFKYNVIATSDIGVILGQGSDFLIKSCSFSYNTVTTWRGGVICLNNVSSGIIQQCTFSNNTNTSIYSGNSNVTICRNKFTGTDGTGNPVIRIWGEGGKPTISNNLIYNNQSDGILVEMSDPYIYSNTITNNSGYGLQLTRNSAPIINSTILWGNSTEVYIEDNISNPSFYYCTIEGGISSIIMPYGTFNGVLTGLNTLDPKFVNPCTGSGCGDWSLKETSPCINIGCPDTIKGNDSLDLAGRKRIAFGIIDMGAYEFFQYAKSFSGTLTSDTIWNSDTIYVNGDITIPDNIKLTILPGVKVYFTGKYKISVSGSINATGLDRSNILFTIPDTSGYYNNNHAGWCGFRINSQDNNDSIIFDHCIFQYGRDTVALTTVAGSFYLENFTKARFTDCTFQNNYAKCGGCISAWHSNVLVDKCIFKYNTTIGVIFATEANITVNRSTLAYNKGINFYFSSPASALNVVYGFLYINDCYIYNNTGKVSLNNSGTTKLTNCIFANNALGIYSSGGLDIYNSTFGNNGGGIFVYLQSPAYTVNIYNNIFYNNVLNFSHGDFTNYSIQYNQIPGWTGGGNNFKYSTPGFISPTAGIGNTYDAANANWNLLPVSLCINSGTNTLPDISLPSYDLSGNPRINGKIIDLGPLENQDGLPSIKLQPVGGSFCEGKNINLLAEAEDSCFYQWQKDGVDISNANNQSYSISSLNENDEGNYVCITSNTYGHTYSNPAFIKVRTAPEITDEPTSSLINKNFPVTLIAKADGSKPLSHKWLRDGIELPDTTFKLYIDSFKTDNEGTYICEMTNSCGSVATEPAVLSLAPAICMVTVSTPKPGEKGHNEVVFDKESKINYTDYKIYRESEVAGYYYNIGDVSSTQPGLFIDSAADPNEQAYLYKIAGVKADKSETDINSCLIHKPIHLLATKGEMGGVQLDWDQYIGFDYNTYFIFRKSTTEDSFRIVHTMSSSTRTWTDDTVVGSNDTLFYYISVRKEGGCNPFGKRKGGSDIYSQSASNMEDNRLRSTGIAKIATDEVNFYCSPNPFKNYATIGYTLKQASDVKLEVYNTVGEKVITLVDMKQLAGYNQYRLNARDFVHNSGVFILKLKIGNTVLTKKLVKI